MNWVRVSLAGTILVLLMTSCGGAQDSPDADSLVGQFQATTISGPSPLGRAEARAIHLQIKHNKSGRVEAVPANWTAGCNVMGGRAVVTGAELKVRRPMFVRLVRCHGPHRARDDALLRVLGSGVTWSLDGDRLTLTDHGTTIRMVRAS